MNMWEALLEFKKAAEKRKPIGIRPKSWAFTPCKRFISLTGVDSTNMFGYTLYDFVEEKWYHTWSVFMPTYREAFEEWEIISKDEIRDIVNTDTSFFSDERRLSALINCRDIKDPDEIKWLRIRLLPLCTDEGKLILEEQLKKLVSEQ